MCAIATVLAVGDGRALAQNALPAPDTFAPQLESDPTKPPRFEKSRRTGREADRPVRFEAIPSGTGLTGFDASNARRKAKPKKSGKIPIRGLEPIEPATAGRPPAVPVSPYQIPIPPLGTAAANAAISPNSSLAVAPGSPGAPPVDIGPIRKPPKKRAHPDIPEDPYAPLGVRVGSFDLFPAVELIGGYNTNPGATPGGRAAWLYTLAPELLMQSNWSRHELKAELRGSYTGYTPDEQPTLSRPYFNGKVDGRIDVRHDMKIGVEARALVSTDNPGSPNLQAGLAKLPVYTTIGGSLAFSKSFNRLEFTLKGDADRTQYQSSTLTDGSTVSNDDRNYNQFGASLRGSYETLPGVKPFVEGEVDTRRHDLEFDSSGFARNSNGVTVRVGSTLRLAHELTGEIAIGYTRRAYEDARLEPLAGLVADASLIWNATALSTVKLTGTSSAGESTIPNVSGVLYRDVGLQVDHAFRRWLIGTLKAGFGLDDYVGLDRIDKRYTVGVGLTYKLNRTIQIKGEARQDWLRSSISGADYTASVFLVGMRFQR